MFYYIYPIRVCNTITIHKAQVMCIRPEVSFESMIVSLFQKEEMTKPGSELVVFSRVIDISALSIYNTNK